MTDNPKSKRPNFSNPVQEYLREQGLLRVKNGWWECEYGCAHDIPLKKWDCECECHK